MLNDVCECMALFHCKIGFYARREPIYQALLFYYVNGARYQVEIILFFICVFIDNDLGMETVIL